MPCSVTRRGSVVASRIPSSRWVGDRPTGGRWLDLATPAADQARRGLMTSLLAIGLSAAVALAIQKLCLELPFGWLPLALAMSTLIAARGCTICAAAVALGLSRTTRGVRPSRISSGAIRRAWTCRVARAAIESTAENFADGVVAPLFWGVLFGLLGMKAYKAITTWTA